jgi:hypothetical protein
MDLRPAPVQGGFPSEAVRPRFDAFGLQMAAGAIAARDQPVE